MTGNMNLIWINAGYCSILLTDNDRKTEDGEYLDMIVQFRKVGKKKGNKNMTWKLLTKQAKSKKVEERVIQMT